MRLNLSNKIIIILVILIIAWLFFRIIKLLIPLILIAIVVGWLWDMFDSKGNNTKYRKY